MPLELNLDRRAQFAAQAIVKTNTVEDLENVIRRALAVLQEQGIYAALLYLYVKGNVAGETIAKELLDISKEIAAPTNQEDLQRTARHLSTKLTDLRNSPKDERKQEAVTQARHAYRLAELEYLSTDVTQDIHLLLLVKQLWEQTLIYSRYACKIGHE